jgi:hypothetical protein
MSFVPFSIDLETIISPEPLIRSQFQESQIEELAKLFLQARDTIKPIIVRKISPISFEVLEGYLEYYAALKAEEIDEQFTSIQAYIVPPELESTILEQYEFLQSLSAPAIIDPSEQSLISLIERTIAKQISPLKSGLQDVNSKLDSNNSSNNNAIERTISEQIKPLKLSLEGVNAKLDHKIVAPEISKLIHPISPLETTSNNVEQQLAELTQSIKNLEQRFPRLPEPTPLQAISNVLEGLNTLGRDDLKKKLEKAGIKNVDRLAKLIYDGRPYESFTDLTSRKEATGRQQRFLTEQSLIKLLDLW